MNDATLTPDDAYHRSGKSWDCLSDASLNWQV